MHLHSKFITHILKFCTQKGLKTIEVLSKQKKKLVQTYLLKPTISHQFSLTPLWIYLGDITYFSIFSALIPVHMIHGGFVFSFVVTKNLLFSPVNLSLYFLVFIHIKVICTCSFNHWKRYSYEMTNVSFHWFFLRYSQGISYLFSEFFEAWCCFHSTYFPLWL